MNGYSHRPEIADFDQNSILVWNQIITVRVRARGAVYG